MLYWNKSEKNSPTRQNFAATAARSSNRPFPQRIIRRKCAMTIPRRRSL